MYPNYQQGSGVFASTQPMMQQPQQRSYMQGPPPGAYQQQGGQVSSFTGDPGLMSTISTMLRQFIDYSVNRQILAPDIANVFIQWSNLDLLNRDPNVTAKMTELYNYVLKRNREVGSNPNMPIRAELINQFVQEWANAYKPQIQGMVSRAFLSQPPQQNFAPYGYPPQQAINPAMGQGGYMPQGGGAYAAVPPNFQGITTPTSNVMNTPGHRPSDIYSIKKPGTGNRQAQPTQSAQNTPRQTTGTGLTNNTSPAYSAREQALKDLGWDEMWSSDGVVPEKPVDFTRTGNTSMPTPTAPADTGYVSQSNFIFKTRVNEDLNDVLHECGMRLNKNEVGYCETPGVRATVTSLQLQGTQADDLKAFKHIANSLPEELIEHGEFFHAFEYNRVVGIPVSTVAFLEIRDRLMSAKHHTWDTLIDILDNHTSHRAAVEVDKFLVKMINNKLEARFRVEANLNETISIDTVFDTRQLRDGGFQGELRNTPKWSDVIEEILNSIIQRVFINVDLVRPTDKDLSDVVKCEEVDVCIGNLDKYKLGFVEGEEAEALKTEIFASFTVLRLKQSAAITNAYTKEDLNTPDITPGRDTPGDRMFWGMYDVMIKLHNGVPGTIFFIDGNVLDVKKVIDFRQGFGTMDRSKLHYVEPTYPNAVR